MSSLTTKQQLFVITMEECGELTQACSKVLRHGLEAKQDLLIEEMGDVLCMIQLMHEHDMVDWTDLEQRVEQKRQKLAQWSDLIK